MILPIVIREFERVCRRPKFYILRDCAVGAGVLMAFVLLCTVRTWQSGAVAGRDLFFALGWMGFVKGVSP